jgi:hypothetical protein
VSAAGLRQLTDYDVSKYRPRSSRYPRCRGRRGMRVGSRTGRPQAWPVQDRQAYSDRVFGGPRGGRSPPRLRATRNRISRPSSAAGRGEFCSQNTGSAASAGSRPCRHSRSISTDEPRPMKNRHDYLHRRSDAPASRLPRIDAGRDVSSADPQLSTSNLEAWRQCCAARPRQPRDFGRVPSRRTR